MHCWPKVGIPIALRKMGNQLPISLAKAAHSKPTCLQQSYPCDRGGSLKLPSTEWHCYTAVHFLPAVCHWLSRSSISPATRDGIWSCLHAKFLLHHRGRAESRRRPPPPPQPSLIRPRPSNSSSRRLSSPSFTQVRPQPAHGQHSLNIVDRASGCHCGPGEPEALAEAS